jgi:hypothetical protein
MQNVSAVAVQKKSDGYYVPDDMFRETEEAEHKATAATKESKAAFQTARPTEGATARRAGAVMFTSRQNPKNQGQNSNNDPPPPRPGPGGSNNSGNK